MKAQVDYKGNLKRGCICKECDRRIMQKLSFANLKNTTVDKNKELASMQSQVDQFELDLI